MKVPALIMAGGKGKRMGSQVEKPLLPFLGKPLIDWVVEAVKSAERISELYVVTSPNTPETEKKCAAEGLNTMMTGGKGYHDDLKQAILKAKFQGPVLIMPSDVPALTGQVLDKIVSTYEANGKDALAVFVPIERRQQLGLSISSTDEYNGVWYAVSGVNVINAKRILDAGKIETCAIVTDEVEVLLNVNTPTDFEVAEKIMRERVKHKHVDRA